MGYFKNGGSSGGLSEVFPKTKELNQNLIIGVSLLVMIPCKKL